MSKSIAELTDAMSAIADKAEAESRALSDEEVTQYEALESELTAVRKTDEIQKRNKAYKSIQMPAVIHAMPKGDAAEAFAFEQYLRTGVPNSDLTEFRSQNETTTTAGGYAVPTIFRQKLTERLVAFGGLAQEAEQFTTGDGRPVEWPSIDDTSATRADLVAEGGATAAGADFTFGTVTLGAYRYAAAGTSNLPVKVSVELLADANFDVNAYLSRALGTRIARKQAVDLMQGSGSGQPKGLLYGTHDGDVALAGGDVITYAKLNALVHKLDPAYRPSAKFIMADSTVAEIEQMVDTNGRPILNPSTVGISGGLQNATLMGYPVVVDQAAYAKANQVNFVAFGDLKEAYIIRRVADVSVLVDPYSYGINGFVGYSAWARMDGQIQNANAVVKLEGTT